MQAKTPADLLQTADLSDPQVRAYVVARMSEMQDAKRESVQEKADRLGIPQRKEGPGHRVEILYDFIGDKPLYRHTDNVNAAISSGANLLRDQGAPYALDGTGMTAAVWDEAKVRNTHQEFPNSRVTIKDSASTFSDHSTHVAGTIGANGTVAAAKGMAPKVSIWSYDWNSDYTEMTAVGAATASESGKIPVSNHSYGAGFDTAAEYVPYMGRYEDEARTTDSVAVALPYYQIFWAAGNEQDYLTTLGGYQSITFNGLAKNVITIGAGNDAVTSGVRDASKGTIASFSSEGPCDDGRIKPDITANGVGVYSSISTSNTAYDTYDGTSMATPNAVGSSILLEQLYSREFSGQRLRASMLKALLIETASDLGRPGPDYQYGWGYINVKAAGDLILAHKASLASPKMIEDQLTNAAKTKTYTFQWDGSSPIRATLCWTDPAGAVQANDSRTPNLVHDLDLKLTSPSGAVRLPYVMPFVGTWTQASMTANATTGVNKTDNVEQVYLATPTEAGTYTMTVSVTANLTTSSQAFSLVVLGGAAVASNPPPVVSLDAPANNTVVLPNTPVTLSATASDTVIGGGAGVVSSVAFYDGTTLIGTDTVAPYSLSWTPPGAGSYALTAVATDSEGASATSAVINLTVLTGNGVPTIASFTPASGAVGDVVTLTGTNFAGVTSVKFNGVDAIYTVLSSTSLTATVPASAATGALTVTNSYGTGTSATVFTLVQSPVLISQIYGSGGNSGATYNSDYIELYNRGPSAVSLAGWSVQYASASGTTWSSVGLSGSLSSGKYYLVKLSGGTTGAALPAADATGTINMSGSNGKVALRNTTTVFTGSSPAGQTGLQDLVGFGTATAFEGAASAPSPSSTTAIFRLGAGATDTGDNSADFAVAAPNPRNTSSSAPTAAPVITSATGVTATVNAAITPYQITATNSPTSFAASGLPAGLTVSDAGVISGTPSATGTVVATISATNAIGTGTTNLTFTISAAGSSTAAFSEDFASITTGDNTTTSGSGTAWTGNTNFPTVTAAYQAGGAVKLGTSSAVGSIVSRTLDLTANGGNYFVKFDVKGWTTVEGSIKVTMVNTAAAAQTVTYTATASGGFETKTLSFSGGTANATLRIETTAKRAYIDNVSVYFPVTPAVTVTGDGSGLTATYGAAGSASGALAVAGTNLTGDITVTAPTGFAISKLEQSGYTSSLTYAQTGGTVASSPLYVRIAAGADAGAVSGSIAVTSPGATAAALAVSGTIAKAPQVILFAALPTRGLSDGPFTLSASGGASGQAVAFSSSAPNVVSISGSNATPQSTGTVTITASQAGTANYLAADAVGQSLTILSGNTFAGTFAGFGANDAVGGVPALMAYALGGAVSGNNLTVLPQASTTGGTLQITFLARTNDAHVALSVEGSTTLTDPWNLSVTKESGVSQAGVPANFERQTWSLGAGVTGFLRVKVTQLP